MPGTNKVTLRVDWTFRFLLRLSQAELAPFMSKIPIQNQIKKCWLWNVFLQLETKNSNINIYKFLIFIILPFSLLIHFWIITTNEYRSIIMPQLFWTKKLSFVSFFHKLRECMSAESQMKLKSHKMSESLPRSLWQQYSMFTAST